MLVKDENCFATGGLSSKSFWKSRHNKSTTVKESKQTKPKYYSETNSITLNLEYNKANIQKFNEKAKNSEKKTFRNNR